MLSMSYPLRGTVRSRTVRIHMKCHRHNARGSAPFQDTANALPVNRSPARIGLESTRVSPDVSTRVSPDVSKVVSLSTSAIGTFATYGSLGAVIGFMVWIWLSTVRRQVLCDSLRFS